MSGKIKDEIKFFSDGIKGSYSQIFFSDNRWLALLVLLASFFDPYTGASGLLSVISSVLFARWMGLNPIITRSGTYTYNSLLVGLTLGVYFKFTLTFFAVLFLSSFFTLLVTIWMISLTSAYRVPFLSLPFMISVWTILMAARSFGALQLTERGIYSINELWSLGGATLVSMYEKTNSWNLPFLLVVYLKSLGAIFFQYNIISGILIAIGLLIYSRIAFTLSIFGFLSGYFFCYFLQGNLSELQYSYIGFNYILSAIAIGGFFLVPSSRSYLIALISAPLIGLLIGALGTVLNVFQLPLYSLPFSLAVILILFTLNNRYNIKNLQLVPYQQYSPEKNLYAFYNRIERFRSDTYFHIHLPFYGEWLVSQGHEGKITHKEDWRFAWDFVVTDQTQKTFRLPGKDVADFFCYGLPVLAPAAGYVVTLVDGVVDNQIGDVNLAENWGNSIVIKHAEYLYSKISHIKNASFKVKVGDYVSKGDILASCGNSGRSPEPHIHFQLQATPAVGAKTIKYPICYYVSKQNGRFQFHSFDHPREGQLLFKTTATSLIRDAFHFIPGTVLEFEVTEGNKTSQVKWEVFVDAANLAYIYCYESKSVAYFTNNETLHYFTDFKGDRNSLLYYFYLGAHKILLSYFQDLEVKDILPIEGFYTGVSKVIQDVVAPFHIYLKADYSCVFAEIDDLQHPNKIKLISSAIARTGTKVSRKIDAELELTENKISTIIIKEKGKCITAKRLA